MNVNLTTTDIEEIVIKAVLKALQAAHHEFIDSGWLSLKEGAKYAGVSYNTLMKYRTLGLQVCEIDGVKRISRKEIDRFVQEHSF
ncbi:helix-turn-helix domain-containing protein [Lysinibacillus fusiformis]|uniref:helix-turn-helix domain-containing protein n=1 Tax=Lysinibacillus fusiformis TaxID=28031 RepID=UPI00148CE461|nr:helix-turn-helix domain-containing protein [Lysinibacillus fusiformis]NOG28989.1 helix-turn-helix domain-containing protein [Lysinibacillus fusiformis]